MKISLAKYVEEVGQVKAAKALGVHQTAISKAVREGRQIYINKLPSGEVKAFEYRAFPHRSKQNT
ncbi:Cro/CI family transcriptional regulator [Scandinavium sp. NPDC088450]|uniref:Cro/CI family transcriptional regulator n=1 Tax=Scandinavium sp. NPDC088450 TaxID=3364514 RepID=UPI0038516861